MSGNIAVCDIDPDLVQVLTKFRFRKEKNSSCIIMKIDTEKLLVKLDEVVEDVDIDELRDLLPCHQPRYTAYSSEIKHKDGRISYPMSFFFTTPRDCKPELMMMYAGSKLAIIKASDISKTFEFRELEDLTQEWYEEKMTN